MTARPLALDWLIGIAVDHDAGTELAVMAGTPEWEALCDWCRFHGLDPRRIPAGSRVIRVASKCLIAYTEFVGEPAAEAPYRRDFVDRTEQGEAPPLPFPDVIARQLR